MEIRNGLTSRGSNQNRGKNKFKDPEEDSYLNSLEDRRELKTDKVQ